MIKRNTQKPIVVDQPQQQVVVTQTTSAVPASEVKAPTPEAAKRASPKTKVQALPDRVDGAQGAEGDRSRQFGFARYGGILSLGETPKATPKSVAEGVRVVKDLAGLAVKYAQAGKPRIAEDVMRDAKDSLAVLIQATGGEVSLHPGKFKSTVGQAQKAIDTAAKELESLAGLKPIGDRKDEVKKKTVLLFGLSANPPTGMGGHAGIVSWGGKDLRVDLPNDEEPKKAREQVGIDEVWVLPVYKHAFASKSNLLPFEHREAMAKIAFGTLPGLEGKVQVKDTEKQVIQNAFAQAEKDGVAPEKVRVGTVDVVRALMEEHPDTQFVLALGGDTFTDLRGGKWKEGDTLQQLVPIVVLPRAGVDGVAGTEKNAPKLTDISSTKVRGSIDEAFLSEALHPDVLAYIKANKLYAFGEATVDGDKKS